MKSFDNLDAWLAHCEQLHSKAIDMGLDRVRLVAQRMQLQFNCPVVTVAGTNGKGSTCAMLESIWRASGYKTGVYGSPHLVYFEEFSRIDYAYYREKQIQRWSHDKKKALIEGNMDLLKKLSKKSFRHRAR